MTTTEEDLDIFRPPPYSCNFINRVLETNDDPELQDDLEEIRDINQQLRMWGMMWKNIAKTMLDKYEPNWRDRPELFEEAIGRAECEEAHIGGECPYCGAE